MNEIDILKQVRFNLNNLFNFLSNVEVMVKELREQMFEFQKYINITFQKLEKEEDKNEI